jgi:hypothetical protein
MKKRLKIGDCAGSKKKRGKSAARDASNGLLIFQYD